MPDHVIQRGRVVISPEEAMAREGAGEAAHETRDEGLDALDALEARANELEDLVRGGHCIRGDSGKSPCEELEQQLVDTRDDMAMMEQDLRGANARLAEERAARETAERERDTERDAAERIAEVLNLRTEQRDAAEARADRLTEALREIARPTANLTYRDTCEIARAALAEGRRYE
jgi:hypothetical protein